MLISISNFHYLHAVQRRLIIIVIHIIIYFVHNYSIPNILLLFYSIAIPI